MVRLYKTQNIFFDHFLDQVNIQSLDTVFQLIDQKVLSQGVSNKNLKRGVIMRALKEEQHVHGFSVVNGILVCNAKVKELRVRKTIFIRLAHPVVIGDGDGRVVSMVACTVSPSRLGALNLRYLSRLTRLFGDSSLIESLRSVETLDGLKLALNGVDAIEKEVAA